MMLARRSLGCVCKSATTMSAGIVRPAGACSARGPRSFWGSWGAAKKNEAEKGAKELLLEAATRDMGPTPPGPMIDSTNPAIKQLAEQYARSNNGCGACPAKEGGSGVMSFSCPQSGFPSHCKPECYEQDAAHHTVVDDLRTIHQDYADLRSGRAFGEFEFPGPPSHDFVRGDLNNWVSFLSDREFKNALSEKIGWARSDEEKFIEARR